MFFLALRQLLSRKRQTVLTLMGIILGTAAYVAISGMMQGFQDFIIDQLVNNDAHIRVSPREEFLQENSLNEAFYGEGAIIKWIKPPTGRKDNAYIISPRAWLDRLENDDRVKASSPQMVVQALANYGKISLAVRVIGSDPEKQKNVSTIEKHMLEGQFKSIGSGGNRIIVGDGLMKRLGASVQEKIFLSVGKAAPQPFHIVGKFNLGVKALDETVIFAALSDVQKLNQTPSRITDIAIRLKDVTLAADTASTWDLLSPEKVQSWDQANEGIMSVFKTQDIVRNSMTISILIVAGFGIYNILSLAVSHKKREIAILRSMGFEPGDITRLFLTQGIFLGFIGGVIGLILGLGVSYLMSTIEVSSNRGLGGNHMIVSFSGLIYVKAFILALGSSCVASFFPARAAGKLEPIEIIRSENS